MRLAKFLLSNLERSSVFCGSSISLPQRVITSRLSSISIHAKPITALNAASVDLPQPCATSLLTQHNAEIAVTVGAWAAKYLTELTLNPISNARLTTLKFR